MAPLPDVAGVLRVTLKFAMGSKTGVVTRFFIKYDGSAPTGAQLNTFAGVVRGAVNTNLKSLMQGSIDLVEVDVVDLSTITGAIGSDSTAVVGTRAGVVLTSNAAVVVSYEIARRYRGGHPRGYWPFAVEGDLQTAQTWTTAFAGAVKTGIDAFFTAVVGAGWTGAGTLTHVNVSYFHGSHVVTNPTTGRARNVSDLRATPLVNDVLSTIVRIPVGSQRRRLRLQVLGLPPPPDTVAWYRQGLAVNGSPCSVGFWLFMPELPAASFADFDSVAGQLRNAVLELVGDLASSDCEDREITVLSFGDRPLSIRASSTGFVGSRGASSPLNASTGIYWATNERGKSGRAVTHVPGFPLGFTDDDVHVNGTCVDAVRLAAAGFLVALDGISSGAILSVALSTLHRSSSGVPLSHSRVALIDHGLACPRIAGIQRRMSGSR